MCKHGYTFQIWGNSTRLIKNILNTQTDTRMSCPAVKFPLHRIDSMPINPNNLCLKCYYVQVWFGGGTDSTLTLLLTSSQV